MPPESRWFWGELLIWDQLSIIERRSLSQFQTNWSEGRNLRGKTKRENLLCGRIRDLSNFWIMRLPSVGVWIRWTIRDDFVTTWTQFQRELTKHFRICNTESSLGVPSDKSQGSRPTISCFDEWIRFKIMQIEPTIYDEPVWSNWQNIWDWVYEASQILLYGEPVESNQLKTLYENQMELERNWSDWHSILKWTNKPIQNPLYGTDTESDANYHQTRLGTELERNWSDWHPILMRTNKPIQNPLYGTDHSNWFAFRKFSYICPVFDAVTRWIVSLFKSHNFLFQKKSHFGSF